MSQPHRVPLTDEGDGGVLVRIPLLSRLLFRDTASHFAVGGQELTITYGRRVLKLLRGDVLRLTPVRGWFWDTLLITTRDGDRVLRGLPISSATRVSDTWTALGLVAETSAAVDRFRYLCERDLYLNRNAVVGWRAEYDQLERALPPNIDELPLNARVKDVIREYRRYRRDWERLTVLRNDAFVARKRREHVTWFAQSAGERGLSEEQQEAVLHDDDNCLVVAGAGTGKTTTVAAKVAYLVHTGATTTDRILLLAFTRKAATEMCEKVEKAIRRSFRSRTFHALGLEIVTEVEARRPSVSALAEDAHAFKRAITACLNELLHAPESRDALVEFFAYFRYPWRSAFDFETPDQYLRVVRAQNLRTLQGERVKSHEEVMIADWLFRNGIRYEYERAYEYDTASVEYRQYKPDFFLSDFGVYLEHFGVDRAGRTAPGIDAVRYNEAIQWKRQTHRDHGTRLLETYSWQRMEHQLEKVLRQHLHAIGATPQPRQPEELARTIHEQNFVEPVANLICTFLSLYKSNAWTEAEVLAAAAQGDESHDPTRAAAFMRVFRLVFERYERALLAAREVDFNDMIASAAAYVESGRYQSRFTHVIVDECQDFSRGRARLVRALLAQVPDGRLFCVGDDWQSIYRFNGSDVALMTHFTDEFGFTKRCDLTRSHRFPGELLEVSSRFIQQNPAQLRKQLSANRMLGRPAVALRRVKADQQAKFMAVDAVVDSVAVEQPRDILVLGRYNHTLPEKQHRRECELRHPKIEFHWLTVHSAKGLEADYALILDVASATFGFPAEIEDDPILDLVLAAAGGYPNAEERRLFYVALTRARRRCYLLVPETSPSVFIDELMGPAYAEWVDGTELGEAGLPRCPKCSGLLVRRDGPYGPFWRCANFPLCDGKASECPKCHQGAMVVDQAQFACSKPGCGERQSRCPRCRVGALVRRSGSYGSFWGCTEWRPEGGEASCTYTHSVK